MKVFYLSKIKQLNFSALIIILIGFTSCGTYQSAYSDDDGIYTTRDRNVSSDTNSNQDDNYFAQKLEEYQNIDNGDLITDVDGYSYQDQNGVYESNDSNYENSPWGYSNDVTININSNRGFGSFVNPFWNNGFNNWGFNNWGVNNWGFNNWGLIIGATIVGDSITGDSITGDMETDGIMGFTDSIISIMADFLGNLLVITIITETTILTEKELLIIAEIIQLKEEFHQLLIEGIALFQVKLILLKEAPITILLEQEV
jgi:hypothetical protein